MAPLQRENENSINRLGLSIMTANAADAVWQKLDKDLKEYGDKVQLAKTQFDGLSDSITKFGAQLEEAQAREEKINDMLQSFMAKIDAVSDQNWDAVAGKFSPEPSSALQTPTQHMPTSPTYRQRSPSEQSRLKLASLSANDDAGDAKPSVETSYGGSNSSINVSSANKGKVHIHRSGSVTIEMDPDKSSAEQRG